jgi:hypothetical protein
VHKIETEPDIYEQYDRLFRPKPSALGKWWAKRTSKLLAKESYATVIRGGWRNEYSASVTTWRVFGLVRVWRTIRRY